VPESVKTVIVSALDRWWWQAVGYTVDFVARLPGAWVVYAACHYVGRCSL
jgi:hypothetical protein